MDINYLPTVKSYNLGVTSAADYDEIEPLVATSQIIYEHHRQHKLEGRLRVRLVFFISILLAISFVITVFLIQYDVAYANLNDRTDYVDNGKSFCAASHFAEIDIISTPIAASLLVLYSVIYRRRCFLRNKYKYRNLGLPMVVSAWNKSNRFYTSFVYAIIAFNVFQLAYAAISAGPSLNSLIEVNDPTKLIDLLFQVTEMFLVKKNSFFFITYRSSS